jgi:hypothetical protein
MVDVVTKQEASRNTKDWCRISDSQERLIDLNKSAYTGHHDVETPELTSGRLCGTMWHAVHSSYGASVTKQAKSLAIKATLKEDCQD